MRLRILALNRLPRRTSQRSTGSFAHVKTTTFVVRVRPGVAARGSISSRSDSVSSRPPAFAGKAGKVRELLRQSLGCAQRVARLAVAWSLLACGLPLAAESQPIEPILAQQARRVEVVRRITRPTIAIFDRTGAGGGSGVIISPDGYALTNFHVVQPCGHFMKCGLSDGTLMDAVLVGMDPTGDVALIKLVGRDDFPVAEIGDSDTVRPGHWCFAAGNPFLLATDFRPTISFGMISGVNRYQYPAGTLLEYSDCLQSDAAVNPGNSGGPLFDDEGRLIGINGRCSFEKRGRVNVGVAYAISINQVMRFLGDLKSGRIVDHATLGATVSSDEAGRVMVTNILESSDAYRRGLRFDDQILTLGGRPVRTVNAFKNVLGTYPRGWRIPLTYVRDGKEHQIHVRLAGVHGREELLRLMEGPQQDVTPPEQKGPKKSEKDPKPAKSSVTPEDSKVSPELERLYEPRRGFANYYFNRTNLGRVLSRWQGTGISEEARGEWRCKGRFATTGDEFEIIMRDDEAFLLSRTGQYRADLTEDLDTQLEPEGSGGLLLALSLWRRFALLGPGQFGEVLYQGTSPSDDGSLADVVAGTYLATESLWFFDRDQASLRGLEVTIHDDQDPCEIAFRDYEERQGLALPRNLVIRHGDREFATLVVDSWQLGQPPSEIPE